MFRKIFAVTLSGLLLVTTLGFQNVLATTPDEMQAVEKVRTKVHKIGIGSNARVEVKLRDSSRLKGYISTADQDTFTVTDRRTGTSKTVAYADTSSLKKAGNGVSAKTWIILGTAVVGAAVTWVIIKPVLCDGGAQTRGPC